MTNDNTKPQGVSLRTILSDDQQLVSKILVDGDDIDTMLDMDPDIFGDRFGTKGQHVARELEGKTGWRDLPEKGPNPDGKRNFLGDEFQGMLGYDASGKPAFWSHFSKPDGSPVDSIDDLKGQTFKVCFSDVFPDHLKGNPSIDNTPEAWGRDPETGRPRKAHEAAIEVNDRMQKLSKDFLVDFGKVTGLNVEFVDDPKEANLTVMAWSQKTRPRLLGFASFPESMNSWPRLRGLGNKPAFMFLNNDYADEKFMPGVTDQEVRNLFSHEFGHNMGWCHPHDLARLNMGQPEALASTLMAYSDMHSDDMPGRQGAQMGAIDYNIRNWWPDAPALNQGYGKVYDMQQHLDASFEKSKNKGAYRRSNLLSTAVIVDSGEKTELHGTSGDDLLDTNKGYASIANTPDGRGKQKFLLTEGHIAVVRGRAGNNTIIPSQLGNQEIFPGTGSNEIQFVYDTLAGNKVIASEGNDTLVLSAGLLNEKAELQSRTKGDDIVLSFDKGSIQLKGQAVGQGVKNIRVVDDNGVTLTERNVEGLSAREIHTSVFWPAKREIAAAEKRAAEEKGAAPQAEEAAADASWAQRVASSRGGERQIA